MSNKKNIKIKDVDIIVIGAGSAGLTSAVGFSKVGRKVLLVEKEHMGGECTNSGCIPSKALLHKAKTYYSAKIIAGESKDSESYRDGALSYVQSKVASILAEETPEHFKKMGIDVVMGEVIFEEPCVVRVGKDRFRFKLAIIATGSSPRIISVSGLNKEDILTNQNVFKIKEIPKRLLVLGSGPIGMELGQAFAMLGSKVTIVTQHNHFAELEDREVSKVIYDQFKKLGIRVLLGSDLLKVEEKVGTVEVKMGGNVVSTEKVPFDKLLMAIGRATNIPKGLLEANIESTDRTILVNSQYRTSNKDVYAIGDVAGKFKFTHTADDTARQVVARIASKKFLRVNNKKAVPKVTYTHPEIASVGRSYDETCKQYDCEEFIRIEVPYATNDRGITDDVKSGIMVLVVRRLTGTVLGANIIGPSAGEIIAIFTLAIDQKISMWKLRSTIYAYPTYSLMIKKAGDMFFALTIKDFKKDVMYLIKKHTPKVVALIFWSILFISFQKYRVVNELSVKAMFIMLHDFVTMTVWGPIVYMVAYAIRPLIFFPATVLTALSGVLFGLPLGILYTVVGENASANFAYWIGRFFGKGLKLEDSFIGKWVEALRKRPFTSVLFMRLFYVPFDLTNYGSGILKVRWRSYALATLIGIMPGLITFVALGAGIKDVRNLELSVESFNFTSLGIAVAVFVISLALSKALKKWHVAKV